MAGCRRQVLMETPNLTACCIYLREPAFGCTSPYNQSKLLLCNKCIPASQVFAFSLAIDNWGT